MPPPCVLALAALLVGLVPCGPSGPTITSGPTLVPNPNPRVPLAARVQLVTDVPTSVELTVDDGTKVWSVTPDPGLRLVHDVPLLGVRPGLTHLVTVEVTDQLGQTSAAPSPLVFDTPALPASFPQVLVDTADAALMEPGVTLFDASATAPGGGSYLVILDGAGAVVWFYQADEHLQDSRRLSSGNLLFNAGHKHIVEIDMFGDTAAEWWASGLGATGAPPGATLVDVDTFHHEVFELPPGLGGDFLTLSTEVRVYPNYPASESDPSQIVPLANVVGDVVVEFRRDGSIVREIALLDVLDPYRISYGSLGPGWNHTYALDTEDWTHANSATLDPSDDSVLVSLRHQEAVVKLDRSSGQLVWILGPHDGWGPPWKARLLQPERSAATPTKAAPGWSGGRDERFEWIYHQHAPAPLPGGRLLLFDNGNGRAVAPAPQQPEAERYSRAVELEIDAARGTVRQVWDYGGAEDKWYSDFLCDADPLPQTQNVLICDGSRKDASGKRFARILEVDRAVPARVVFQVRVLDPAAIGALDWTSYRAERLPGVYP